MEQVVTVGEVRAAIVKYVTEHPKATWAMVAAVFGLSPNYIARIANNAGIKRGTGKRVSKVSAEVIHGL